LEAVTEAFAEHLCEHCLLVRVGAAGPFPAPYRYSVTFVMRGEFAEAVGFSQRKVAPSDFETVIRLVNKATGKLVAYDRAGSPPTRVVQIDPGLINGRILMTHRKPHHASHANTDTPEGRKATADELRHVADLVEQDKLHMRNGHEGEVGHDGWQKCSFERKLDASLT
jgi:hypothetical protein